VTAESLSYPPQRTLPSTPPARPLSSRRHDLCMQATISARSSAAVRHRASSDDLAAASARLLPRLLPDLGDQDGTTGRAPGSAQDRGGRPRRKRGRGFTRGKPPRQSRHRRNDRVPHEPDEPAARRHAEEPCYPPLRRTPVTAPACNTGAYILPLRWTRKLRAAARSQPKNPSSMSYCWPAGRNPGAAGTTSACNTDTDILPLWWPRKLRAAAPPPSLRSRFAHKTETVLCPCKPVCAYHPPAMCCSRR